MSQKDQAPIPADFSNIPLPPEGPADAAPAAAKTAPEPDDVAVLDFIDAQSQHTTVALDHPFRWKGVEVRDVTVKMPSFADVVRVYETAKKDDEGKVALIEFYAAMTGLPASVLRAMPFDDSEKVTAACIPFLPRDLRASVSS